MTQFGLALIVTGVVCGAIGFAVAFALRSKRVVELTAELKKYRKVAIEEDLDMVGYATPKEQQLHGRVIVLSGAIDEIGDIAEADPQRLLHPDHSPTGRILEIVKRIKPRNR